MWLDNVITTSMSPRCDLQLAVVTALFLVFLLPSYIMGTNITTPVGNVQSFVGGAGGGCVSGSPLFRNPDGMVINATGSMMMYVADWDNHVIQSITLTSPITVAVFAGTCGTGSGFRDGELAQAQFAQPVGLAFHDNVLYIADEYNCAIRRASATDVTTIAGVGGFCGARDGELGVGKCYHPME